MIMLLTLLSCQKPVITQEPAFHEVETPTDILQVTGYYNHQTCTVFYDARIGETGALLHDDTTDPFPCDEQEAPFKLKTFLFPAALGSSATNYRGLRLESRYPLTAKGFQLSAAGFPDLHQRAAFMFTFTTPGKWVLQIFFREFLWQQLLATGKLEFSFQVTSTQPELPKSTYALLQGHFNQQSNTLILYNAKNETGHWIPTDKPYSCPAGAIGPEFQFQATGNNIIRIRSLYTLLTEDFHIWNQDPNCQKHQNWDLQLIPATGYNLLDAKLDPLYSECLQKEPR